MCTDVTNVLYGARGNMRQMITTQLPFAVAAGECICRTTFVLLGFLAQWLLHTAEKDTKGPA